MNRREALSAVSLLFGGAIVGAQNFLAGCSSHSDKAAQLSVLTDDDITLLDEIGEIILPATASSPGAKNVNIGMFMDTIVADCYEAEEQEIFLNGLKSLRAKLEDKISNLTPEERQELVKSLEKEAADHKTADDKVHYYTMIKQLTLWGYFTSEPGATKALRHVRVPGRYEACIPLKEGQKAWG